MLICVPDVLSKTDVADFRRIMDGCAWEDGRSTAGAQSALVKRNEQLPPDSEIARKLGNRVVSALTANPRFIAAAVPLHIFPPPQHRLSGQRPWQAERPHPWHGPDLLHDATNRIDGHGRGKAIGAAGRPARPGDDP